MDDLTRDEIEALADAFPDRESARRLLEAAGLPARRQPAWSALDAESFWSQVAQLIKHGKLVEGRRRLFAAASIEFPGNRTFAAAVAQGPSWRRCPDPHLLPALPHRLVPRPKDAAAVRALLAGPHFDPERDRGGARVVGLVAMGGAGKSTLARQVVCDEAVRRAFPDGIVWIDVGQQPDLRSIASLILTAFGDRQPVVETGQAVRRLRSVLAGAYCLIVLDDVWSIDVLRFLRMPARTRLLVTTRDRGTLFTDADVHELAPADDQTSRRILAAYSGRSISELPDIATTIVDRCGGLALALAVIGGMVSEGRRWETAVQRLRSADLARLSAQFEHYPHLDLLAALDASVRALSREHAARFLDLAVFQGRGPIPAAAVFLLWQATGEIDDLDADDLLDLLVQRSLVQRDPISRTVTLHDLLFDYARGRLGARALAERHEILADQLLAHWGGLSAGLPLLPRTTEIDDVALYGISELVGHLLDAGRPDLVDELLELELSTVHGPQNLWYAVHEKLGRTSDYLAAVRAAWEDAKARLASNDRSGLARQIRYALYIGSVTSRAATIPPSLLLRVVEAGIWTPHHALAYAQLIPESTSRARALSGLAPHLPQEQRTHVLDQALTAAATITNELSRAEALSDLAPLLPAELTSRALTAAIDIRDDYGRSVALRSLAPYLPTDQLLDALRAALTIDESADQIYALTAIVPCLPAHLLIRTPAAVVAAGTPRPGPEAPADTSQRLNERRDVELADVLPRAMAIPTAPDRAQALFSLALQLPTDQRTPVFAHALASATAIDDDYQRAAALAALAPHLTTELLDETLGVVSTLNDANCRSLALSGLAPYLPSDLLEAALAAATAIDSPASFARIKSQALLPDGEKSIPAPGSRLPPAASRSSHQAAMRWLESPPAGLLPTLRPSQSMSAGSLSYSPPASVAIKSALVADLPAEQRDHLLGHALEAAAISGRGHVLDLLPTILAAAAHPDAEAESATSVLRARQWWP
ncbi:hypothetical protein I6A60_21440 [Frankia sp. AgB1.9]|uniref:NB-ARC domain-containing protein n=1 Tax=unclassified Frankia TaxID=2632575 RepID=UPI001932E7D7|nr:MULTISPECIES: NB-ARC domain-containing protein [unclassified Frankia]MBL7487973.1 hypothetical protein [Frankia sp. AgW1.1]MBL7550416.1 hypothetical protein [Frankia sp. AgB1.9]MBL7620886.1 hypothetical protein [Frankia sp. AgB1.8]